MSKLLRKKHIKNGRLLQMPRVDYKLYIALPFFFKYHKISGIFHIQPHLQT
jgi:hypothetical protein